MNTSRYDRQQRFAPIGEAGQRRIETASVLIVGVGALGSVVAELLGRAGVGRLRIVDRDTVEWSNLQRQSLYTESDAREGLAKVHAAANRLTEINASIQVQPIAADVTPANIESFAEGVDLIVDGTDNFEIRFLINDLAWERSLPWIHGGCLGTSGQVFAFRPGQTICFRCLVPSVPDASSVATCDTAGVLGPATHMIASLQALEAIKVLVRNGGHKQEGEPHDRLLAVDMWSGRYRSLETKGLKKPTCPCCGEGRRDFLRGNAFQAAPVVLCGRNAVQISPSQGGADLNFEQVARSWVGLGDVSQSRFLVRLKLTDDRSITLFRDGRAVIGGTEDPAVARALYARFVGG
jgi:molybdopterin-synthase adenylyltransferase